MEGGAEEAFADVCRAQLLDSPSVRDTMQLEGDRNLLRVELSMNGGEDVEQIGR